MRSARAGMPPAETDACAGSNVRAWVGFAVALGVCFALLKCVYGYVAVLQSDTHHCFYMVGRSFLLEFTDHPGGLLVYAGRFLGQFYLYPWLSALIVSVCIGVFFVLLGGVLRRLGANVRATGLVPPCVLLLALHTSEHHFMHDTLGLMACCGAFAAYLSVRRPGTRRLCAFLVTPFIYGVLGAYAWLFVAWVAAVEWLDGRRRADLLFVASYLCLAVSLPWVAMRWVFPIPLRSALVYPLVLEWHPGLLSVYYLVDRCVMLVLVAYLLLLPGVARNARLAGLWRPQSPRRRLALSLELGVLALLLFAYRYDSAKSEFAACRRLYVREQWDELLKRAHRQSPPDLLTHVMTNRALCEKGKLLDEMFRYPQMFATRGLILNFSTWLPDDPSDDDAVRALYNSDLYFEMGHVNAAFRHAYDRSPQKTYQALARMAECCLVNDRPDLAGKYVETLAKTLVYRQQARRYAALIADPDAAEERYGGRREWLPLVEHRMETSPITPALMLLKTRPDNRMAFDYVTAWSLLEKRLDRIPNDIEAYRRVGYASMPVHCQEALLLLARAWGAPVEWGEYAYDAGLAERVEQFLDELSRCRERPDAPQLLAGSYGDTYMFYYFFAVSPDERRQAEALSARANATRRQE